MNFKNKIYLLGTIYLLTITMIGCNNNDKELNTNVSNEVLTSDKNTEEKVELEEFNEEDYDENPTEEEDVIYKEYLDYLVKDNHSVEDALDEVSKKHSIDKGKLKHILNKCLKWETLY